MTAMAAQEPAEEDNQFITYGNFLGAKPNGCYRLAFHNFNSVLATTFQGPKPMTLWKLLHSIGADGLLGAKVGIHGKLAPPAEQLNELFCSNQPMRVANGYNRHEELGVHQPGCTCMLLFDYLATTVTETGVEDSGLGQ